MNQQIDINEPDMPLGVVTINDSVTSKIASSREVTEAQGAIFIAKRFPRDEIKVLDKVIIACQRPTLAESALYSYAKGGTDIQGPSIRMAELLIRLWGNAAYGIRELESSQGESVLEAFAVDYEANVRQVKVFTVKHERTTKKGTYALTDAREKYENLANFGARRVRACILGLIPADIIDAAINQVEETLKAKADTSVEAIKKMSEKFMELGITKDQIEKRIQRRIDSITSAQVINLRKIYNSLKDGMSKAEDWFEVKIPESSTSTEELTEKIKGKGKAEKVAKAESNLPEIVKCPNKLIGDATTSLSECEVCESREGCPAHD
jgi:hypothetical protein